jgi:hypothetical protein
MSWARYAKEVAERGIEPTRGGGNRGRARGRLSVDARHGRVHDGARERWAVTG